MDNWLKYCVDKRPLDCDFSVYYKLENDGGGPIFIKNIYSKKHFLDKHKDCKSLLEVCSGPGFVGWYLFRKLQMDEVHFLDIHEPVKEDLKMTADKNSTDLNFYLSDGFKNYNGPKVDLIVCNSPFMNTEKHYSDFALKMNISGDKRIKNDKRLYLDKGLELHKNLLENFNKFLTDKGRIVFLQDKQYASRERLEKFNFTYSESDYFEFKVPNKPNYDNYILTYFK